MREYRIISILILIFFIESSVLHATYSYDFQHVDTVPTPWHPLEVESKLSSLSIKCWGREYQFNNSILPFQIYSLDKKLLESPIYIDIQKDNKTFELLDQDIFIERVDEDLVELKGKARISGLKNSYLRTNIVIEYDGLMIISLFIESEEGWEPDIMSMIISYNGQIAKNFLKWPEGSKHLDYYGKLPDGNNEIITDRYTPYYWIGDDYKGLFWFCEGIKDWPNNKSNDAIKVIRDDNRIIQNFNLGKTSKFTFGLQATPVKPLPDNWRKYRITNNPSEKNIRIKWIKPGRENSIKFHSWPQAENEGIYKELVEDFQKKGHLFYAYAATTRLDESLDVLVRNKFKWEVNEIQSKDVEGGVNLTYIHPESEGFADSLSEAFVFYMREYNLDGYYLDGGGLFKYWKDKDGNRFFPILAYRELQKKLYEAVKKTNPKALIITHMSTQMDIPVLAYSDAYVDGEQFRSKNKEKIINYAVNDSYLDKITLDQFRTEFMGKQWGLIPFFLPEFSIEDRKQEQPTLGLATLLLLHDVQPWAGNSNIKVWSKMYDRLDDFEFSAANVEFVPYYSYEPIATSKYEDVLVSAYRKENETLLIIGNLSKKRTKGKIKLNKSYFENYDFKSIYSLVNSQKKTKLFNRISYDLEPLSYDLIWIK